MALKFDDCASCRFRRKPRVCAECDVGELYEDEDAPTLDIAFETPPARFGESVTSDDAERRFDPDRFLDDLETKDECDEDEGA